MGTVIVLAIAVAVVYVLYARLIVRRNKVLEALGDIDVQLTKRHDLIPNVLRIAERFMEHERTLLDEITAQRNKAQAGIGSRDGATVGQHLEAETQLQGLMTHFFAVAEAYPQLKSAEPMLEAQATYNEVEEHIAAARRFYNAAVAALDNARQVFPGSILSRWGGISAYPYYRGDDAVRAPVDADAYLRRPA